MQACRQFFLCLILLFPCAVPVQGLDVHHARHLPAQQEHKPMTEEDYDLKNAIVLHPPQKAACTEKLSGEVYGFHPYWYGTAYKSYDFSLLSTVSYFAYHVDPETGGHQDPFFWETTELVDIARRAGCRVELTVTNFGSANNDRLLGDPQARRQLLDNLVRLLKIRGADGVCIDFESIPGSRRDDFTAFVREISWSLKKELPGSGLSLALYAVDWNHVFDIPALIPLVDRFILMAYDYHTASSPKAGPVAPLKSGRLWWPYNVERSMKYYLDEGVPASKLLLSVPYYGQQWRTKDGAFPSANLKHLATLPYRKLREVVETDSVQKWDTVSRTPVGIETTKQEIRQAWFDDPRSLTEKYRLARARGLAGVAIFALGYDNGHSELWQALHHAFCTESAP